MPLQVRTPKPFRVYLGMIWITPTKPVQPSRAARENPRRRLRRRSSPADFPRESRSALVG
jgi:hypothetical protein